MKTVYRIALVVSCLTVACSSSSDNPSAADTVKQFVGSYCQALEACISGTDAGATFTMSTCVSTFTPSPLPSGTEACSQDQVNQCLTDIKNAMCSTLNPLMLTLPGSCKNC